MEAYNVWGDWDIYIVLQYEIVWSVIPTLQTRIHTYLFSPQTVSCYPQSLGEDETSLKGQELHETAQKSFLKAAFEVEVEVQRKACTPIHTLPLKRNVYIWEKHPLKHKQYVHSRADCHTTAAKQQLNKRCCPGAFGSRAENKWLDIKTLTSSISLQSVHQPTHPPTRPNSQPMEQKHCAPCRGCSLTACLCVCGALHFKASSDSSHHHWERK